MSLDVATRPIFSGSDDWDRYYQVGTDIGAVLGTPGVPSAAFGESVRLAGSSFVNTASHGLFLRAERPAARDPIEVSAELTGTPSSGVFASVSGPRRRSARNTRTGTHVQVEQLVRGARVVGGDMRVHQDDRGVFALTGRPLGQLAERDPGPAPPIDEAEALNTCLERFELEGEQRAARVEQVVFPGAAGATWAYEVGFVVPEHGADVRVLLRADDFSVLLSYNISSSATGTAQVYPVNPLQTPSLTEVSLKDLDEPGETLRGAAIAVSQASGSRLERTDGNFAVDPSDPAFDEVQVYHHLWRVIDWFGGLVQGTLLKQTPFTPMRALVNDPQSPENAFYSPTTGELRFGLFGSRSSARSAAVVCHEFGHAVTDAICRLGRAAIRNTESRGLSEGYSDYFAASFLDDPRLGDYVANNEHGARNCSDAGLHFPDAFAGEEHATGAVWAGVLWALRESLGASATDVLVLESLEFLDSSSTFTDAQAALLAVDEKLFDGVNRPAIEREFAARSPA